VPEQCSRQSVFLVGVTFFCHLLAKSLSLNSTFQILFYALRPGFVRSQKLTYWHFVGIAVQLTFDFLLVTFVPEGQTMLIYLIMSSFWAGSLHPLAGHFIAEHYVWDNLQQETYSYYGWLNIFAYNVSNGRSSSSHEARVDLSRLATIMNTMISPLCRGHGCQRCTLSRQSSTTLSLRILHGQWLLSISSEIGM
jgi:hypothetical protein